MSKALKAPKSPPPAGGTSEPSPPGQPQAPGSSPVPRRRSKDTKPHAADASPAGAEATSSDNAAPSSGSTTPKDKPKAVASSPVYWTQHPAGWPSAMVSSRSSPGKEYSKPEAFFQRTDLWIPETVDPMTNVTYRIKVRCLSLTDTTPLCNNDAGCVYCEQAVRHTEALCLYLKAPLALDFLSPEGETDPEP